MPSEQPTLVVVLDPGHGGTAKIGGSSPNNARGPNGLLEKHLTLDVATRTAAMLSASARVVMTRTSDVNISLTDRAAVARASNADVFVSIHFNGFHDASVDGTEVWISRSAGDASAQLADKVLTELAAVSQAPSRGVRRSDLGVLLPARHAPTTAACLAEIAFLTNPDEASRLAGDAYRQQIAQALATAILSRVQAPATVGVPLSPAASAESLSVPADAAGGDAEARRQAAAIGGHGSPTWPAAASFDTVTLSYGVAGGVITDPFYRDVAERTALTGRKTGRAKHLGMDVSTSNAYGGGADDPRRGLPVYAAIASAIDISNLNTVRATRNEEAVSGLGIDGQGAASLQEAVVSLQPWSSQDEGAYGGVVGLACRYRYTKTDGSPGIFTLYIEYLHLITSAFLPKDGQGHVISAESWAATGKGIGFGPRMQKGARLTAEDLAGGEPLLVGYLGATQFPHVHIQAAYGAGEQGYLRTPRFDPTVMLRSSATTTQAWALGLPALALNDQSFHYDIPGTLEPLAQPASMACWATAGTMLISWRDQASYSITGVCDMAGPAYRGYFDKNTGLARADLPAFLQRLGLQEEPPACYAISAYKDMLRTYGPLWVTADVGSPGKVSVHARVMTGLYGDGSADNTFVWLVDPADGKRHSETFAHFSAALEQLALDVGSTQPLWVQIVHYPRPPFPGATGFAAPSSAAMAAPAPTETAPHPGQGPGRCGPAALSLGIAYAPPLSSALYDTGEHVRAGEQAYSATLRVGPDPGVPFTYGELVAMADLYGSVGEMMRASSAELTPLKALIDQSAAYYRGHKADKKLDVRDEQWDAATGHRYLRLAEDNYEHFSSPWVVDPSAQPVIHGDNHTAWKAHHQSALEEAHRLALAPENATLTFVPEWPLIINAFGDHFLTDAFSAGHLVNKDVVLAAVQSRFYSGNSLTSAAEDFLGRVAREAFTGDVAAKFSELETYDRPTLFWGIPLPWRPNIDSVSMFQRMLQEFATQEPGKFGNVLLKMLHDHLNEHGVMVSNQAGDQPWLLTGDGFLSENSLSVMRRAVARSVQNVLDVADSRQPGPPDVTVAADRVWRFVPQLPQASRTTVSGLMRDYTDPSSRMLSSAVAQMIHAKVDVLVQGLLAEHKLRRA